MYYYFFLYLNDQTRDDHVQDEALIVYILWEGQSGELSLTLMEKTIYR